MVQKVVLEEFKEINELPIIKLTQMTKDLIINSDKIFEVLKFKPKYTIEDAKDLVKLLKKIR